VNYPNRSDRLRGQGALGGDIFIHGGCETAGCIAVTDDAIKELYWIGVEAKAGGQDRIPVHIFPARLTEEELGLLGRSFARRPELVAFWSSLKPGFDFFERNRQLPPIRIDANGHYSLLGESEERTAADAKPAR
jgi:murein L,D-transpeptidase YafK